MSMKRVEGVFRFLAKSFGIAYLIGLMSFLGLELHARDGHEYRETTQSETDAIRVPRTAAMSSSQVYSERLKALDALFNSGIKRQILDLRVEVSALRRQLEVLKWNSHDARAERQDSPRRRRYNEQDQRITDRDLDEAGMHGPDQETQVMAGDEEANPRLSREGEQD